MGTQHPGPRTGLSHYRNTLQFDGDGRRQCTYFYRGAARFRVHVAEIFTIQSVEGGEVALHVYQVHGNVHKVFPPGTGSLQNRPHIPEHTMHLCFEVERGEIAAGVHLQAGHLAVAIARAGHAWPDSGEEQQIAHPASVGVQAYGLRGFIGVDVI